MLTRNAKNLSSAFFLGKEIHESIYCTQSLPKIDWSGGGATTTIVSIFNSTSGIWSIATLML